jgi:hypothetical protein
MGIYEAIKCISEAFQIPVMKVQNLHAPSNGIIQYTGMRACFETKFIETDIVFIVEYST